MNPEIKKNYKKHFQGMQHMIIFWIWELHIIPSVLPSQISPQVWQKTIPSDPYSHKCSSCVWEPDHSIGVQLLPE